MNYLKKLFQRNLHTKRLLNKKIYYFNVALLTAILALTVGYFLQVNTMVYKGYAIRDIETRINQLDEEYSQLELESVNLQSIQSVRERAQEIGLVHSDGSEFLVVMGAQVAQR